MGLQNNVTRVLDVPNRFVFIKLEVKADNTYANQKLRFSQQVGAICQPYRKLSVVAVI